LSCREETPLAGRQLLKDRFNNNAHT
jgi:hypothetical protein